MATLHVPPAPNAEHAIAGPSGGVGVSFLVDENGKDVCLFVPTPASAVSPNPTAEEAAAETVDGVSGSVDTSNAVASAAAAAIRAHHQPSADGAAVNAPSLLVRRPSDLPQALVAPSEIHSEHEQNSEEAKQGESRTGATANEVNEEAQREAQIENSEEGDEEEGFIGGTAAFFRSKVTGNVYLKIRELGRGAGGVVYVCRRLNDAKLFAVKEVRYKTSAGEPKRYRSQRNDEDVGYDTYGNSKSTSGSWGDGDCDLEGVPAEQLPNAPPTGLSATHQQGEARGSGESIVAEENGCADAEAEEAIAMLMTTLNTTINNRRSVLAEGTLMATLPAHPNIVQIEEIVEVDEADEFAFTNTSAAVGEMDPSHFTSSRQHTEGLPSDTVNSASYSNSAAVAAATTSSPQFRTVCIVMEYMPGGAMSDLVYPMGLVQLRQDRREARLAKRRRARRRRKEEAALALEGVQQRQSSQSQTLSEDDERRQRAFGGTVCSPNDDVGRNNSAGSFGSCGVGGGFGFGSSANFDKNEARRAMLQNAPLPPAENSDDEGASGGSPFSPAMPLGQRGRVATAIPRGDMKIQQKKHNLESGGIASNSLSSGGANNNSNSNMSPTTAGINYVNAYFTPKSPSDNANGGDSGAAGSKGTIEEEGGNTAKGGNVSILRRISAASSPSAVLLNDDCTMRIIYDQLVAEAEAIERDLFTLRAGVIGGESTTTSGQKGLAAPSTRRALGPRRSSIPLLSTVGSDDESNASGTADASIPRSLRCVCSPSTPADPQCASPSPSPSLSPRSSPNARPATAAASSPLRSFPAQGRRGVSGPTTMGTSSTGRAAHATLNAARGAAMRQSRRKNATGAAAVFSTLTTELCDGGLMDFLLDGEERKDEEEKQPPTSFSRDRSTSSSALKADELDHWLPPMVGTAAAAALGGFQIGPPSLPLGRARSAAAALRSSALRVGSASAAVVSPTATALPAATAEQPFPRIVDSATAVRFGRRQSDGVGSQRIATVALSDDSRADDKETKTHTVPNQLPTQPKPHVPCDSPFCIRRSVQPTTGGVLHPQPSLKEPSIDFDIGADYCNDIDDEGDPGSLSLHASAAAAGGEGGRRGGRCHAGVHVTPRAPLLAVNSAATHDSVAESTSYRGRTSSGNASKNNNSGRDSPPPPFYTTQRQQLTLTNIRSHTEEEREAVSKGLSVSHRPMGSAGNSPISANPEGLNDDSGVAVTHTNEHVAADGAFESITSPAHFGSDVAGSPSRYMYSPRGAFSPYLGGNAASPASHAASSPGAALFGFDSGSASPTSLFGTSSAVSSAGGGASPFSPFSPTANAQSPFPLFEESELVEWYGQLASAVEFLHSKGIAHRDIKLDNILLMDAPSSPSSDADEGAVGERGNTATKKKKRRKICKLCDFGVAATVAAGGIATLGAASLSAEALLTNYRKSVVTATTSQRVATSATFSAAKNTQSLGNNSCFENVDGPLSPTSPSAALAATAGGAATATMLASTDSNTLFAVVNKPSTAAPSARNKKEGEVSCFSISAHASLINNSNRNVNNVVNTQRERIDANVGGRASQQQWEMVSALAAASPLLNSILVAAAGASPFAFSISILGGPMQKGPPNSTAVIEGRRTATTISAVAVTAAAAASSSPHQSNQRLSTRMLHKDLMAMAASNASSSYSDSSASFGDNSDASSAYMGAHTRAGARALRQLSPPAGGGNGVEEGYMYCREEGDGGCSGGDALLSFASPLHRHLLPAPLQAALANAVAHRQIDDTTVGTPQYMPPEICDGRPHSLQCDVWSLGVSFYEMACRRLPFDAGNMLALMHKVIEHPARALPSPPYSRRLGAIILSMLAKDPRRRPTMRQVVQMLAHYEALSAAVTSARAALEDTLANVMTSEAIRGAQSALVAALDAFDDVGAYGEAPGSLGVAGFSAAAQPSDPRTLAEMLRLGRGVDGDRGSAGEATSVSSRYSQRFVSGGQEARGTGAAIVMEGANSGSNTAGVWDEAPPREATGSITTAAPCALRLADGLRSPTLLNISDGRQQKNSASAASSSSAEENPSSPALALNMRGNTGGGRHHVSSNNTALELGSRERHQRRSSRCVVPSPDDSLSEILNSARPQQQQQKIVNEWAPGAQPSELGLWCEANASVASAGVLQQQQQKPNAHHWQREANASGSYRHPDLVKFDNEGHRKTSVVRGGDGGKGRDAPYLNAFAPEVAASLAQLRIIR